MYVCPDSPYRDERIADRAAKRNATQSSEVAYIGLQWFSVGHGIRSKRTLNERSMLHVQLFRY
jgi:hypothetical protein